MENEKDTLNIVVVGHVDHGKSTVIGRLLQDTHSIPEGAIERVKRISKEKGKPFEYAYLLDAFEEEQKQGITIDTTQIQFQTAKRDYVIIDAPGHKEFLKNMISGAANAEAALLIIDANEGIQEQSKRHGYILSLLGIKKVYVLVNKMDLIGYSEEKFIGIEYEMNRFLNNLNVFPLKYIPISAFYGDNMIEKSKNMPWYSGKPVLEAIDDFEKGKGLENIDLRFPIQDVYKFDARRIIAGRIESGQLRVGDQILISPSNRMTRVKSIEAWVEKDRVNTVEAGMSVGITVEDEFFNKRGEFISHLENPPLVSNFIEANLFWMGKQSLFENKKYKLKLATQEVECEIFSINRVIDATTLITNEDAVAVRTNDVAEVILKTKESIAFDPFHVNQHSGRFVLVDGYDVCGGGIVSGLVKALASDDKFVKGDLKVTAHCFDEYFMLFPGQEIQKFRRNPRSYALGDPVPIAGETYSYPVNFNLLDLENKCIVKIRNSKFENLYSLDQYSYEPVEHLDVLGLTFRVKSSEDYKDLLMSYKALENHKRKAEQFASQWLDFSKHRTIGFKQALDSSRRDYSI